jgi:hypothetical protein
MDEPLGAIDGSGDASDQVGIFLWLLARRRKRMNLAAGKFGNFTGRRFRNEHAPDAAPARFRDTACAQIVTSTRPIDERLNLIGAWHDNKAHVALCIHSSEANSARRRGATSGASPRASPLSRASVPARGPLRKCPRLCHNFPRHEIDWLVRKQTREQHNGLFSAIMPRNIGGGRSATSASPFSSLCPTSRGQLRAMI